MEKLTFKAPEGANVDSRYLNGGRGVGKHNLEFGENSTIVWKNYKINGTDVCLPSIKGFMVSKLIACGVDALEISNDEASIVKPFKGQIEVKTKKFLDDNNKEIETKYYLLLKEEAV